RGRTVAEEGRTPGDGRSAAGTGHVRRSGEVEQRGGRRVSAAEIPQLVIGTLERLTSSAGFVLGLFIGFFVVVGFTKLKRTAGDAMVIKSLDERVTHKPMEYLAPTAPRGPADQLKAPELLEAAARK